ncbi:Uma2 family endonuclease [Sorangium sp. So ce1097]|uniref:Uma2 family endonuclease n=1 Tax=Sorangium sp. So ce1097 TaxID=3133330 RepID=UPI003F62B540
MAAAAPLLAPPAEHADAAAADGSEDQLIVLHDVSWEEYEALLAVLGDRAGVRVTYCEGVLELMSPGGPHEGRKTILARLVEAYAEEAELPLSGYGSMTVRRQLAKRGVEPDECYVLGTVEDGGIPELAIEIIEKSGTINKLSVYAGLGVPEVWFLKKGKLSLHVLGPDGYAETERSRFLPGLDIAALTELMVRKGDQTTVVRAWRAMLRERGRR